MAATSTDLSFARALQDVDQRTRHFLLVLDADARFQHRAQQHVVVGGVLCKLLVHLHGQDVHALVTRLDPNHRPRRLAFGRVGRTDRVPLLHELPAHYGRRGDVDQSDVVVLVLLLLLVRVLVEVRRDALDWRQVVELKVLTPEDVVGLELAGGAGVKRVVQAQLAEILLLGRQILGLDDPQLQQVLHPPAVVLRQTTGDGSKKKSQRTNPAAEFLILFRLQSLRTVNFKIVFFSKTDRLHFKFSE